MAVSPAKKPVKKKPAAKKKAAPKKATAKKAAPKKVTVKKAAPKKMTAKKTVARKTTPKKTNTKSAKSKAKAKMNETAQDFRSQAGDAARTAANKGKGRAAETMGGIGGAIRESAKNIDDSFGEEYGDYARGAADKVDDWAERLDGKEVDDMVDDAREFVRKRPAIAIGAAAIAGFALVRLLRSGRDA